LTKPFLPNGGCRRQGNVRHSLVLCGDRRIIQYSFICSIAAQPEEIAVREDIEPAERHQQRGGCSRGADQVAFLCQYDFEAKGRGKSRFFVPGASAIPPTACRMSFSPWVLEERLAIPSTII
jgi:hypothetical protein